MVLFATCFLELQRKHGQGYFGEIGIVVVINVQDESQPMVR
jgi:hypothetical protein